MTNAPVIRTDPTQDPAVVESLEKMEVLERAMDNMPAVDNEEDAALVAEYRTRLRLQAKELDQFRLAMTAPLRNLTTDLNKKFHVYVERAERAAKICDNLLMPWMREQKRLRDEAEAKAAAERAEEERLRREEEEAIAEAQRIAEETADTDALKKAEANVTEARAALNQLGTRSSRLPIPPMPAKSVKGVLGSTTGLRENWKYKVVDISKVPEEYLVDPEDRVRRGMLNNIAKSQKGDASVPGIEFYCEDALSSTAASRV